MTSAPFDDFSFFFLMNEIENLHLQQFLILKYRNENETPCQFCVVFFYIQLDLKTVLWKVTRTGCLCLLLLNSEMFSLYKILKANPNGFTCYCLLL